MLPEEQMKKFFELEISFKNFFGDECYCKLSNKTIVLTKI